MQQFKVAVRRVFGMAKARNVASLNSTVFKRDYYVRQLGRDVTLAQAIAHYLNEGAGQGFNPNPLFDTRWYLTRYPDLAEARINPLVHFMHFGAQEGRDPHQLIDGAFYIQALAAQGMHPNNFLVDFLNEGWRNGVNPSPLFDLEWYLRTNPDIVAADINPLVHYEEYGRSEMRSPSPLFSPSWYLSTYPDVAAAGVEPFAHFLTSGVYEGRNPHPLFDTKWYADKYPDVTASGLDPWRHFLICGASEQRDPGPLFSSNEYLRLNPDVAENGMSALRHYLLYGQSEQRQIASSMLDVTASEYYLAHDEIAAATLSKLREDDIGWVEKLFLYKPLNVVIDPARTARPTVSILLPGVNRRYATGGPNTAYILGCLLAQAGIPINFVSMDAPPDPDLGPIKLHLKQLTGIDIDDYGVRILDASNRSRPFHIGAGDVFIATAWWTAQAAKAAAALTQNHRFYYLIQDYECMFYGASVLHAVAKETYEYDHQPIINTAFLKDQLVYEGAGNYADPTFVDRAITFEPAVDRNFFYPEREISKPKKKLLFYTRPTMAERNLFGLGVAALRAAVEGGLFDDGAWEFIGMGEAFDPIPLGKGHVLHPAPWLDFAGYASLMRSADLLLSLMFSPHPSYPPLEMAVCGKPVVTTSYGVKSAARLRALSPNIIAVEPRIDQLVFGLTRALSRRERADQHQPIDVSALPPSWVDSLSSVLPRLIEELGRDNIVADHNRSQDTAFSSRELPASIKRAMLSRRSSFRPSAQPQALSVMTPLDGADLDHVRLIIDGMQGQTDPGQVDWIIVGQVDDWQVAGAIRPFIRNGRARLVPTLADAVTQMRGRFAMVLEAGAYPYPDAFAVIQSVLEQAGLPQAVIVMNEDAKGSDVGHPLLIWNAAQIEAAGVKLLADPMQAHARAKTLSYQTGCIVRVDEILIGYQPGSGRLKFGGRREPVERVEKLDGAIQQIILRNVMARTDVVDFLREAPPGISAFALTMDESVSLTADAAEAFASGSRDGLVAAGDLTIARGADLRHNDGVPVDAANIIVDREFLIATLDTMPPTISPALLACYLVMNARRDGRSIVGMESLFEASALPNREELSRAAAAFGAPLPFRHDHAEPLSSYGDYLAARISARSRPVPDAAPSIALLTTVYERTNVALFRETARAVKGQSVAPDEWIVLSHGAISGDLAKELRELEDEGALRWLDEPNNMGIHGGLRYCLERATSDFAISLDADDLITADAVALIKSALADNPDAQVLTTDEDILVEGTAVHPFYRSDRDPVHLRVHSAIWHCIIFRRIIGLDLGVYTNGDAQYAQDWDTLLRFELAGHQLLHLHEVVYHWRQHATSLSNSGSTFQGSLDSIRACLDLARRHSVQAANLSIEEYPLAPAGQDFYLCRQPVEAPKVALIELAGAGSVVTPPDFPFSECLSLDIDRGINGLAQVRQAVSALETPYCLLLSGAVTIPEQLGLWQAIKHLEMVPELEAVSGVLAKTSGRVIQGSLVRMGFDLFDPLAGRSVTWSGDYWLALSKAHCIDFPVADMLLVRTTFLREALAQAPENLSLRSIAALMGLHAHATDKLIAVEPLWIGFVANQSDLVGDQAEGLRRTLETLAPSEMVQEWPRRGVAGFQRMAGIHPR